MGDTDEEYLGPAAELSMEEPRNSRSFKIQIQDTPIFINPVQTNAVEDQENVNQFLEPSIIETDNPLPAFPAPEEPANEESLPTEIPLESD